MSSAVRLTAAVLREKTKNNNKNACENDIHRLLK